LELSFQTAMEEPTKRFKHQSHVDALKQVHLPPALSSFQGEHEIADNESHFHESLQRWRQLSLAPSFLDFAQQVEPMAASMPLLLHNWREIMQLWLAMLQKADVHALTPLFDLLQRIAHDLRTTLSPIYSEILSALTNFLPRSIPAATLTSLLLTLQSWFKYLLVPSVDPSLLSKTISTLFEAIPKCHPEVQRSVAEVLGSTLRRLKSSPRNQAIGLISQNVQATENFCAWVFASACQSVSQTLHTAAPGMLAPLFQDYLEKDDNSEHLFTLLHRLITSLIHHVKDAERFSVVGELLIQLCCHTDNLKSTDLGRVSRTLRLLTIPCSVRKGSRMTHGQLSTIISQFESITFAPELQLILLRFAASALTAGDISLWINIGKKALEHAWGNLPISFAVQLSGALAELGWGGWKQVALPLFLRGSLKSLDTETITTIAVLCREGMIDPEFGVDVVWRVKVENWLIDKLKTWGEQGVTDSVGVINDVFSISENFPTTSQAMLQILDLTLADQQQRYSSLIVASCLRCLSKHDKKHWGSTQVDVGKWVVQASKQWPMDPDVLGGLVALVQRLHQGAVPPSLATVPVSTLHLFLKESLLSHSRPVRLNALKLLLSANSADAPASHDMIKRCLQGEEVPLDAQGVRERVLRIGRIGVSLRDDDALGQDIALRWLTAQLKVNLRPLWSPAASSLASLSQRQPIEETSWRLMFAELISASSEDSPLDSSNGLHAIGDSYEDVYEEERTWRDPSAHKMRVTASKWNDIHAFQEYEQSNIAPEKVDKKSYEHQLLSALCENPALVEKHNREFVPHFLSLFHGNKPLTRPRLLAYLALLSKFSNPKALFSTQTLLDLYTSLLSHPDRPTRTLALSCYLTYKPPSLVDHEKRIKLLLDETKWRDEIIVYLDAESEEVNEVDRPALVDIVIRLLYGLMIEHKGRARGRDRRATILSTISGFQAAELSTLVQLMLQTFKPGRFDEVHRLISGDHGTVEPITNKQRVGFLVLLGDVMTSMGPKLISYWPALLQTVTQLTAEAQIKLSDLRPSSMDAIPEEEEAEEEEEEEEEEDHVQGPDSEAKVDADTDKHDDYPSRGMNKNSRNIRQLGVKRLADFFKSPVETFDFRPFVKDIYHSVISPRLATLPQENAQGTSSLINLLWSFTSQLQYVRFLIEYDNKTLPQLYACLAVQNVKPESVLRIFDVIDRILAYSEDDEEICLHVIQPHISTLLASLTVLGGEKKLELGITSSVGQRLIVILSRVAKYCKDEYQSSTLVTLLAPLLRKPPLIVAEKIKVNLLKTLTELLPSIPSLSTPGSETFASVYDIICRLFQRLKTRTGRVALVHAYHVLATINPALEVVASLLDSLNSFSTKRIEEPDFNRRLEAYTQLNESLYTQFSSSQYLPLLYHLLHDIHDPTELAIRTNAAYSMRRFIDATINGRTTSEHQLLFSRVLYPGLKTSLRSTHELVRTEVLGVIAYSVVHCTFMESLRDMQPLLIGVDEEANFFNNIHHVQAHRRTRALRRLAEFCDEGKLRSGILSDIFIPVVAHYITSSGKVDHHVVNEAIQTTGKMARHLAWSSYFSLVQKYIKLSSQKRETERAYARTLLSILDNFHFPMEEAVLVSTKEEDGDEDEQDEQAITAVPAFVPPATIKQVSDAVNLRLIPSLLTHLEKYDATTEDVTRIPIAVGIVRVVKHLPESSRQVQIERLLTVVSQILRSKSQETRDLTRDTLCKIIISLGPGYLPVMMRELRLALTRGPQLHVLAYVVHALLVQVTSAATVDDPPVLDSCVNDVAYVSAEVVFGESGKDVQSENFKTKMREVRTSSSKALDSFAIVAQHVTPSHISALLLPLKSILWQTQASKPLQLVEEVLRRIASGMNSNPHLLPPDLLVLCHTLITQNSKFLQHSPQTRKNQLIHGDAIIQTKRNALTDSDHFATNSFRFITFGLDLLHTALRRNRFDFHDASTISRLDAMLIAVGNTLYSTSSPVLTLGLKTVAGLVKCPLRSLDKSLPVFIKQILDLLKQAGSTEPEFVQVALKSLATILRDGPPVQVKEKDLIFLLELLTPDLEDPLRQSSVFTILRAIVARKFVVAEIYDVMDKVSGIMITSQSTSVQEMCRSVLLQFLLDYPQGKGRLRKQMTFFCQNLSYVYESGRRSVMELLDAVLSKFQVALVQEYTDMLFVSLIMSLANEDSGKCKEMAAHLIKSLTTKLGIEHVTVLISHLHTWSTQASHAKLAWVASQVYGLIIDALGDQLSPYIPAIMEDLNIVLHRSSEEATKAEEAGDEEAMDVDCNWQAPYHALVAYHKITKVLPAVVKNDAISWDDVVVHLLYPHAWVRTAACRLLGVLFSSVPPHSPRLDFSASHPFSSTGMQDVARKLCLQLKSSHLDDKQSLLIVKNLFYLGKCFALINREVGPEQTAGDDTEEGVDEAENQGVLTNPLPWLFSKLSYQMRSAHLARLDRKTTAANWVQQPLSILQVFAAIASFLDAERLESFLVHILTPIYRITEDSTIRDPRMEELKVLAIEVQELVQERVGISKFSAVYSRIRQGAEEVRRERRINQGTKASIDPAGVAKRKANKSLVKKESKKRKNRAFAERTGRTKRHRSQ
jgi:U3 small nucleolar RNA-associated protein 20